MSAVKILRLLIVCEVVTLALSLAVGASTQGALPDQLQAYLAKAEAAELTPASSTAGLLGVVAMVAVVVAWVGLWRLWRPARAVYTVALVAALAIAPFTGPVVSSATADTIGDVASICMGMILGLLYFSELRQYFDKRPV